MRICVHILSFELIWVFFGRMQTNAHYNAWACVLQHLFFVSIFIACYCQMPSDITDHRAFIGATVVCPTTQCIPLRLL